MDMSGEASIVGYLHSETTWWPGLGSEPRLGSI